MDAVFKEFPGPQAPGCAVAILKDGAAILKRNYGEANVENDVPITSDTRFYLASMSKQFTAAAVLLAAEQGRLSLDDDVRKYIPALPDYGHRITVGNLLHQTSGLRDFLSLLYLSGERIEDMHDRDAIMALIVRQRGLSFTPGTLYQYSNSNYFLLGEIVRIATGQSLRAFAKTNIFDPLGMNDTFFADTPSEIIKRRASGYALSDAGEASLAWAPYFTGGGAGDVTSTVNDLIKWDANFYDNKLGRGGLIAAMRDPGRFNDGTPINYGGGLMFDVYRGVPYERHTGAVTGFSTLIARFPQHRYTSIALCNVSELDSWRFGQKLADLYLAAHLTRTRPTDNPFTEVKLSPSDLQRWVGLYRSRVTGSVRTISIKDGRLVSNGSSQLLAGDGTRFRTAAGYPFVFSDEGGVATVTQYDPYPETYERFTPAPAPTTAQLAAYVGDYYSPDLQVTYHVSLIPGGVRVAGPRDLGPTTNRWPTSLVPGGVDEAYNSRFGVRFSRSADHRVTGLILNAGRGGNLAFDKVR